MMSPKLKTQFDLSTWKLYIKYGFGEYPNYLNVQNHHLTREQVIEALQNPEVRKIANKWIESTKNKLDEVTKILNDNCISRSNSV